MNNLSKEETLLLEEYKLLNNYIVRGSSVFWSRFSIIFSINLFLFSVCSFLFKLAVELDTSTTTPSEFWIYISLIGLCTIIGIIVTIIWYFIIEKSSAMNALWNDRMRIIEETLDGIQIQTLQLKIFTIRRKKFIKKIEDTNSSIRDKNRREENTSNEVDTANGKKDVKSDTINFIERLRPGQRFSIGSIIRHIIFTIFLLWIAISILFAVVLKITIDKDFTEVGRLFFYLLIPLGFAIVYLIFSLSVYIKWRCKIRNQFVEKENP